MSGELKQVIEQISKEKGMDREVLIEAVENAMLQAARKKFGYLRDLEVQYSDEIGEVEIFEFKNVVEMVQDTFREINLNHAVEIDPEAQVGDSFGMKLETRNFGRIAAQTAKQVIIQKIREAERNIVYNEYKDRKGELITGMVRRFERRDIIVDLGRAEAILRYEQQIPRESYKINDRIEAYILDIPQATKGAQIFLSRTSPNFLTRLFEVEVPEISDGLVQIIRAVREPGSRAKIAVYSKDMDIDPIGACVGIKGSRVQNVVQELRGEKIDIVPYDEDSARFVCNALQPAEVKRVLIDEESRSMEIVVPDDQLSLAIGRRGQNVRLASQLTEWRLDIHSETRMKEVKENSMALFLRLDCLNETNIEVLFNHRIRNLDDIIDIPGENFTDLPTISEGLTATMKERAVLLKERLVEEQANGLVEDKKPEEEEKSDQLTDEEKLLRLDGIDSNVIVQLKLGGYHSVEHLLRIGNAEELAESTGLDEIIANQIFQSVVQINQ